MRLRYNTHLTDELVGVMIAKCNAIKMHGMKCLNGSFQAYP